MSRFIELHSPLSRLIWRKDLAIPYSKRHYVDYKQCYQILGISEDSDQEQIRQAYLALVKKYHPDSGTVEANSDQFHKVDQAFKILLNKKSQERWDVVEESDNPLVKEQEIKHKAPQHRQYLEYEGEGVGTPSQRQKQHTQRRAMRAIQNVLEHRIKSQIEQNENNFENSIILHKMEKNYYDHKIKTKYGFERLVEDLIQESMSKGEFHNLKNTGKPLPSRTASHNPYVDFVTHKMNEVLIDNGFTPEWIMLQREIREEIELFRKKIMAGDVEDWEGIVQDINRKIDKFNLVVPILNKQMVQLVLKNEMKRLPAIRKPPPETKGGDLNKAAESSRSNKTGGNVLDFMDYLFGTK